VLPEMPGVDHGDHSVQSQLGLHFVVDKKGLDDRSRIGKPGRFHQDVQGLRMKNAGEDLLHVSVIPCGHLTTARQAGL